MSDCNIFHRLMIKFRGKMEAITKRLKSLTVLTVSAVVASFARTSVVVSLVKRLASSTVLTGKTFTRTLARSRHK